MAKKDTTKKEENEIKKDVVKEIKEKVLNDLNKEIKNTIIDNTTKYKEDLKEEISNDIQIEIANIMKKEEKRILRGKSFAIIKRDILALILLAISLYFGYCLYDAKYFDFMKSTCEKEGTCLVNESNNEEADEEEEIVKDTAWYIKNYSYLLEDIKVNLNADSVSAYYLYSKDYKVSEIKSSYLLNMAYSQLNTKLIKTNTQTITVNASDLRDAFENLFGSLTYYKDGSFTYNCLNFTYSQEKDRYTAENNKCTNSKNKILEEIDEMYEEGDVLYMLTTAAIYNSEEKSFYTFDSLYDPIVTDVTQDDLNKNAKKLNKYQYQFKKVDGIYYLDSIIKLK